MKIKRSSESRKPQRILLYGTEGIGKSSWAKSAPAPVFVDLEDGLSHLDVPCVTPTTYVDVVEFIKSIPQEYKTIVIDTADALEHLLWDHVKIANGWKSIEDPGYGKGYVAALDEWRNLLKVIDGVRARGVEVVIIAHASSKVFQNPAGPDYSRFEPKLHAKAAALLKEWSDAVFFACHDETVRIGKGETKAKVTGNGSRVMHTTHAPAWDAKNRMGLPDELPFEYAAFAEARKKFTPTPDLKELALAASKKSGVDVVREAIAKITGGNLASAKPEHTALLVEKLKELS